MDKQYLSEQLAEALGNAQGIIESERRLINDGQLEFGMKRQLQEIYGEDEEHVRNIEQALDAVGRTPDSEKSIERGRSICRRLVESSGDDPIEMLKATILAKYMFADSQELFCNLCGEIGQDDICELFVTNLEEEEDHLDYLRQQAMLMARERVTGIPVTE